MSEHPDRRAIPPEPDKDRRKRDIGPPPGKPDRRRTPTYDHRITLGSIIQSATIALSVLGAAVTAVFASGAYVQKLRDDLLASETRKAEEVQRADSKMIELLQRLA